MQVIDKTFNLDERSKYLRRLMVEAVVSSGRGHLASAFSLTEIIRTIYDDILYYDSLNPNLANRDRFILSKGHGCIALYAILADKGYFPVEMLKTFCNFDSILGGHPEPIIPGVEVSTGSLGHGLPIAVGMALHAKIVGSKHKIFVLMGDGECNEGTVWEAAMSASKHKLNNLLVMVDYNKQQSFGSTYEVLDLEPFADKWSSFGFEVKEIDGHNLYELKNEINTFNKSSKLTPKILICHTVKGKGINFMENNLTWHHKSNLSNNQKNELLESLKE